MDATEETRSWPGRLHWNRSLHRELGGCSLHFWFLRIPQMYDPDGLMAKLAACAEQCGAGAYTAYELAGQHDVLLRVWLPTLAVGSFAAHLEKEINPEDDRNYSVLEVVRHWVWQNGEPVPRACDVEEITKTFTLEELERVNELSDVTHQGETLSAASEEAALLDRLFGASAITTATSTDGVRLVIQLSPNRGISKRHYGQLVRHVALEMDALGAEGESLAKVNARSRLRIHEASMYRCSDRTILVLCRIPAESWPLVRPQLLSPLGEVPGVAQTTTYPVLSPNYVISRGQLRLNESSKAKFERQQISQAATDTGPADAPDLPARPIVHDQLDREEDEEFEAKGSAFTPLVPWLERKVDADERDTLKEEPGFFQDTIAKSVVAMLNTEGGLIMIGALEQKWLERQKNDRLRLRGEGFELGGHYRFLGLEDPTYRTKGWDGFARRLHRLLTESIVGELGGLVRLYQDFYRTRPVALLEVRYPGMRDGYYLKRQGAEPTFYIRRGSSSEPLSNTEVPAYIFRKRTKDRRP